MASFDLKLLSQNNSDNIKINCLSRRYQNCTTSFLEDTKEKNGDYEVTSNGKYVPIPGNEMQMEREQHLTLGNNWKYFCRII